MRITRRELSAMLPALFLLSARAAEETPLQSKVYQFDKLPVKKGKTSIARDVLQGKTATGETIEVHETTLQPGGAPHPPHHHEHSEMFLIRRGTVEVFINGARTRFGPGSVAFIGSNDEHGIRNVGATPAMYFVVAIGPSAQRLTK
jgi:mannose-6-phosphate isomerase-like protein (cupin superfamily)